MMILSLMICLSLTLSLPESPLEAPGRTEHSWSDFARQLVDLAGLPNLAYRHSAMESSYDRTGANKDGFNPNRLKDGVYTIAELQGPGVIRRFYTARPGGQLRIYIDGSATPVVDMPAEDFFSGRRFPFVRPATGPLGGANYSFLPISYARSVRIETSSLQKEIDIDSYGRYYQVSYETFPKGTRVESFKLPLTEEQQQEWRRILKIWSNAGEDPKPTLVGQERAEVIKTLVPGDGQDLITLEGPAAIDRLILTVESQEPQVLRSTLLRIWWDEEDAPAVDVPVGDFFGNGFNRVPYRSLPMGLTQEGYYCYFPMPFARRAHIAFLNESPNKTVTLGLKVVLHKTAGMADDQGYFHAKWRRQEVAAVNLNGANTTGFYNYRILDAHGKGRYVGANLNVFSRDTVWWGEGDPMIFVDGESWPPSFHGTGTEEYFNDAWGFNRFTIAPGAEAKRQEESIAPVSGVLLNGLGRPGGWYGGNAVFTFHISDSIPFEEHIEVTVEAGTENNMTNDYASTAYWYALPSARDFFFMRPVQERETVPPEGWKEMYDEALRHYRAELRRQVSDTVWAVHRRPTDARNRGVRNTMIGRTIRKADLMGLREEDREELEKQWREGMKRPQQEEWKTIDQVMLEIGRKLGLGPVQSR